MVLDDTAAIMTTLPNLEKIYFDQSSFLNINPALPSGKDKFKKIIDTEVFFSTLQET